MTSELTNEILSDVYDMLGHAASFTPQGGSAISVTVLPDQGDGGYEVLGLDLRADRCMVRLRVSEIATPLRGDGLNMDGTDYVINAAPQRLDPERAEWTLELIPA